MAVADQQKVDVDTLAEDYEAEKPGRRLGPIHEKIVQVACAGLSLYAIYWVLNPVPAQRYRTSFLAVALALTFLVYRGWGKRKEGEETERPGITDWLLAIASIVALGYTLVTFDEFVRRAAQPNDLDIAFGVVTILLVLEATRRTVGWILPAVVIGFLLYAYFGGELPATWQISHAGYGVPRIVGQTYMGLSGIFGVPLDVAATYIILFTLYGAVLEYSGAGTLLPRHLARRDRPLAHRPRPHDRAGRLPARHGVGLGRRHHGHARHRHLADPAPRRLSQGGGRRRARRLGHRRDPVAADARRRRVHHRRVPQGLLPHGAALRAIPSLLYYLGILLAIEADARRFDTDEVVVESPPFKRLLLRYGYHFSSLFAIVVLLAVGFSPFRSVLYATVLAFLLSFLDPKHRMGPVRVFEALAAGARAVLPVAATCAAAGIIVAVVTLTGLGLNLSGIIIDVAGGSLFLCALLAAIAVLLLGLAVPVTASFIIAAVIVSPALTKLGVEPLAAYMFIFYYAVLSEVSPPTALSAVAAAAITGGNAFRTMMLTWKYTLPAFLVPFAFVLTDNGEGLLLQGSVGTVVLAFAVSALAVAALAVATGAWLLGPARLPERLLCGAAGLVLLYLEPLWIGIGLGLFAAGVAVHLVGRRQAPSGLRSAEG